MSIFSMSEMEKYLKLSYNFITIFDKNYNHSCIITHITHIIRNYNHPFQKYGYNKNMVIIFQKIFSKSRKKRFTFFSNSSII